MLELQQEYSELSSYKQIQRKINANSTEYFFSFSSFKILHRLIKSFVIPTLNRVFGSLKNHFLKSNSKNLKNLNRSKNLKFDRLHTKQTIRHTRKLKCISLLRIVLLVFLFVGTRSPRPMFIIPHCRNGSSGWFNSSIFSSVGGECLNGIHTRGMLNSIHTVDFLIPGFRSPILYLLFYGRGFRLPYLNYFTYP